MEQNAHMALRIAHRGYVLQTGTIVLEDSAAALAVNEAVRNVYIGRHSADRRLGRKGKIK
jgi:branched-chain amino acid transport system ATP-binding protein